MGQYEVERMSFMADKLIVLSRDVVAAVVRSDMYGGSSQQCIYKNVNHVNQSITNQEVLSQDGGRVQVPIMA